MVRKYWRSGQLKLLLELEYFTTVMQSHFLWHCSGYTMCLHLNFDLPSYPNFCISETVPVPTGSDNGCYTQISTTKTLSIFLGYTQPVVIILATKWRTWDVFNDFSRDSFEWGDFNCFQGSPTMRMKHFPFESPSWRRISYSNTAKTGSCLIKFLPPCIFIRYFMSLKNQNKLFKRKKILYK